STRIYLNSSKCIGVKEKFKIVCDTDLEAQRNFRDIDVTGIAVVVTDGRTERKFTFTQGGSVINGKKTGRATHRAPGSNCWCRFPLVSFCPFVRVARLGNRRKREHEQGQGNNKHSVSEFHHNPPPKKNSSISTVAANYERAIISFQLHNSA